MAAKVQFNVYLPPELVRDFKHAVVDDGTTLSAAAAEALRLYLEARAADLRQDAAERAF